MFGNQIGRSGWAVLAAGALVASLLAVGSNPVNAAEENADHKAATSACVGDALGDQMYSDVSEGHVFRDHINCISYYGITNGTGDGSTFSPNDDVTRAEMAVFLARAAGVAGVDLGDAMDEGYGDIDDVWAEAQDAINQLTGKGILAGGDNYRPNDAMTRAEMALALIGLLDATGAVEIGDDGAITIGADGSADDYFADARAQSPAAVDRAAAALFELGVTDGTGSAAVVDDSKTPLDTNFDPSGTVDRGQMAAFITRALAHTSARPEGVTAQALSDGVIVISQRDENFAPVANQWVEAFYVDSADEGDAFTSDGECGRLVAGTGNGTNACEIDGADLLTNGDGDAETQPVTASDGGVVAWAWGGDIGDAVDDETALFRLTIDKADAPAKTSTIAAISNDLAGTVGKIGSSVTVTLQLQDADGDVTGGALDANEPAEWVVYISTFRYSRAANANLGTAVLATTAQVTSDADGKGTFTLASLPDLNPDTPGDAYQVTYDIRTRCTPNENTPPDGWANCKAPANGAGTFPAELPDANVTDGDSGTSDDHEGGVIFSDEAGAPAKVEIDTASYVVAPGRAGRAVVNRAEVKVVDQFGDGVRNAHVSLTSDLGDHATDDTQDGASSLSATTGGTPRFFTTDSDGIHTFGYTYASTTGDVETLTATYDPDPDDTTDTPITATATVNWAQEAGEVQSATAIVGGDVDANHIVVVVSDVPMYVTYDDDDRFNTNAGGGVDVDAPASMAEFEKVLAAFLATEGSATETVEWSNYSSRPRNTSVFTLDDTSS